MPIIIKFCKELYTRAIVRRPGRNFANGITSSNLGKPDFTMALEQHAAYCEALVKCGVELTVLEADERYPDGCFVEDTAVVNSRVKVISRPGAATRRGEEEAIARVLAGYGPTESITTPGTLEGGDILRAENHYFIGISERTNKEGAGQLSDILSKHGFTTSFIPVEAGLHLKSDIAYLGDRNFVSTPVFSHVAQPANTIILDPDEYYSANCLRVNEYLLIAKGFPKSRMKMLELGYNIIELDMSEFSKMDGGLTCLSLLF
ncbi:MAG TPA: N(G),N(G)-dimethylarginine dimethylaminohydrolase [Bacteroidales bacterium]|nr:N(G),N(G)-dimethylarginine dimethylaminohydrolase [Bacteroidales bacterium]